MIETWIFEVARPDPPRYHCVMVQAKDLAAATKALARLLSPDERIVSNRMVDTILIATNQD